MTLMLDSLGSIPRVEYIRPVMVIGGWIITQLNMLHQYFLELDLAITNYLEPKAFLLRSDAW